MADDLDDGEIYADGCFVRIAPKRSETGCTLGGDLAEAINDETAAEIARRCQAHELLLSAAKEALEKLDQLTPGVVLDAKDSLRAAIRLAEASDG